MSALKMVVLFVVLTALSNLGTVAALPWIVNAVVMHKIAALAGGYNRALPAPRADASARTVVRPSPDLLYTACVFDVSERPLHITAPVQDSYVSIAGFAADTSNFFAINDAAVQPGPDGRKSFDVVLTKRDALNIPAGVRIITAPSDKGLILFRSLITNEVDLPRLQKNFQEKQLCTPL